jgi:hypothetical protein
MFILFFTLMLNAFWFNFWIVFIVLLGITSSSSNGVNDHTMNLDDNYEETLYIKVTDQS